MNRRITARAIIVHDGKLLCLKHKPYEGHTVDYWCTPGGGIDNGEVIADALKRELVEELGIEPVIGNLLFVQQFNHKSRGVEEIEFFFNILNSEAFLHIDLEKTSHDSDEIEHVTFLDPAGSEVIKPIFLKDIDFSGNFPDRPAQIFSML